MKEDTIFSYKEEFIKFNSELYYLIRQASHKHNYLIVMKIMGGDDVSDDIEKLYMEYPTNNAYSKSVLEYFKKNLHKHNDWITALKFHLL